MLSGYCIYIFMSNTERQLLIMALVAWRNVLREQLTRTRRCIMPATYAQHHALLLDAPTKYRHSSARF